jgi:hypothetical protein
MSTTKGRRENLQKVLQLLSENDGKMKFRDLYKEFVLDVTQKTFWDYLESLRSAGKIEIGFARIGSEDETEITLVK